MASTQNFRSLRGAIEQRRPINKLDLCGMIFASIFFLFMIFFTTLQTDTTTTTTTSTAISTAKQDLFLEDHRDEIIEILSALKRLTNPINFPPDPYWDKLEKTDWNELSERVDQLYVKHLIDKNNKIKIKKYE